MSKANFFITAVHANILIIYQYRYVVHVPSCLISKVFILGVTWQQCDAVVNNNFLQQNCGQYQIDRYQVRKLYFELLILF